MLKEIVCGVKREGKGLVLDGAVYSRAKEINRGRITIGLRCDGARGRFLAFLGVSVVVHPGYVRII